MSNIKIKDMIKYKIGKVVKLKLITHGDVIIQDMDDCFLNKRFRLMSKVDGHHNLFRGIPIDRINDTVNNKYYLLHITQLELDNFDWDI